MPARRATTRTSRVAEQQLPTAAGAERVDVEARLDFLRRNLGELVHDLRGRNGHRVLRTMPQLVGAVRTTPDDWVSLR